MNYTIKKSLVANLLFCFAIFFRINSEITANLAFVILLITCFFGPRHIIISLILSWVFSSLNAQIAPYASYAVVIRFVIFFTVFLLVFPFNLRGLWLNNKELYINFFLLFFFIIIHSFLISEISDVSIFKALNWFLYFFILLICWSRISDDEYLKLLKDILIILLLIVSLSLFFLKNDIGYIKNTDSFQGILNHPQIFGMVMGLTAIVILNFQKLNFFSFKLSFFFLIIVTYFLILSESRTAIFAFFGAYIIFLSTKNKFNFQYKKYINVNLFSIAFSLLIFLIILFLIYKLNDFFYIEFIDNIFTKSGRLVNDNFLDVYLQTRGELIFTSYDNIYQKFWNGIGFGLASQPEQMMIIREEYFGIPLNAPVEKGQFIIAILEELGFFGLIFFIIFLLKCLNSALNSRSNFISIFFIVLFFNLGESSFFSTGGIGGLLNIFFTMAIAHKNFNNAVNSK